jgi:hypothetical protein
MTAALPTSVVTTSGSPAGAASPDVDPTATGRSMPTIEATPSGPAAIDVPPVFLIGPFGTLDGMATDGRWPGASDLQTLDAYVESAPLDVGFRDPDTEFAHWTIRVAPIADPSDGAADVLDEGPAAEERADLAVFDGPSAGDWILRADVTAEAGDPVSYHWSLHVPDRPFPSDRRIEPPLPELVVGVGGETATAALGSSCYIYTCADVPRPAVADLPTLEFQAGDALTMTLSDESGLVSWVVSAWPAADRDDRRSREVDRGEAAGGTTTATADALESGDWYVSVSVVFDLERGSATYYVRLRDESSGRQARAEAAPDGGSGRALRPVMTP